MSNIHNLHTILKQNYTEVCESNPRAPPNRVGYHAVSCIGFSSGRPQMLLSGGRHDHNPDSEPLGDIWMFDLQSRKWKEVSQIKF